MTRVTKAPLCVQGMMSSEGRVPEVTPRRTYWTRTVMVAALALFACSPEEEEDLDDAVVLGALLPYTGKSAGIGDSIEKSLLMLKDSVNASGGVLGRRMGIDAHDTHSDAERGLRQAEQLLARSNLHGIIGPEEPELAVQSASLVQRRSVIQVLPGNAAPKVADPDGVDLWFRTGPSASAVASALVSKMRSENVERLQILFEPDAYGAEMNRLIACQFQAEGGTWSKSTPLVGSISVIISSLTFGTHDAIALITQPETGARVVVEQTLVGARPAKWFLAPTLDSSEFTRNVLPGSLINATGIAPALAPSSSEFAGLFQSKWGDAPLTTTYYYYDSAALWALATEAAARDAGGTPSAQAVAQKLRDVSSPPGEVVDWNNLAHALQLVRAGVDIDYQGVTGSLDIGPAGEARQNTLRFWHVPQGSIAYDSPADYSQALAPQCL